jgi:hypothetical protein
MLVYRDTKRERAVSELKTDLLDMFGRADRGASDELALEALLRAGELECGLADLTTPHELNTRVASRLTDALAKQCLAGVAENPPVASVRPLLASMRLPERVRVGTPEGYAYYRLDPRTYAACASSMELGAVPCAVIGIRSIGTSLSAIVSAALRQRGVEASRVTVRPSGHPWSRQLSLDPRLYHWVRLWLGRAAQYLIVDEGPGLSGSTFVAVARALEAAGVPASRITFICSHMPSPAAFTSETARRTWDRYRTLAAAPSPIDAARDLSAGAWRRWVFGADQRRWPASWTQLERVKQLTEDERWLEKFEGFQPYCQAAFERARTLAESGVAPEARAAEDGFVRYAWLSGRPAERIDLERGGLDVLTRYCALRAQTFACTGADCEQLQRMVEVNVREALGVDLDQRFTLELESPVVPDARMQPHKWVSTAEGRYYKVDGHGDGDGHLLPGPCDACWDLAGAIVEWRMSESQSEAFVSAYERETRDLVHRRLPNYLVAYCALRVGELSLAALSAGADEAPRIDRARTEYRSALGYLLRKRGVMA